MGSLTKFGAAAAGIGAAVGGIAVVADSVKKAMDFESQMSTIKALTGSTDAQMKQMQALALEQGAITKYSALEAAQGIEELLKAGLSTKDVQDGGLNAALNLATAGGLDLAEAAEIMSTSLNGFKDDALKASEAADILAGTANASATDVHDLRYSLAAVGSVANGVGMSFRDTNAALGVFANRGLKGSDAGTSLKTMLMNLSPATDSAYGAMKELGIITKEGTNRFYDAEKSLKSLDEVAEILHTSLKDLSAQERQDYLRDMFGSDAIRAGNILYKEGAKGIRKFYDEMSNVKAVDVAKEKMNNAAGAVEQFRGAVETLQISALMPTMPILKDLANAASAFVVKYTPQITEAMERGVAKARNYLNQAFFNNPEFKKLPDLESKVRFVFDDLLRVFNEWWSASGRASFQTITSNILGVMIDVVEASAPQIATAAMEVGSAIAFGVMKGIKDHFNLVAALSPTARDREQIEKQYSSYNDLVSAAAANSKNNPGTPLYSGGTIGPAPDKPWYEDAADAVSGAYNATRNFVTGKSRASGLDNVPYNQYPASLHKGEMVLTRGEAADYRDQQGGGDGRPTIVIQNVHINNGMDYQTFVGRLAKDLANA